MGQSTNAILCYGFEVGEEDEKPDWMQPEGDNEEFDFDDFVASRFSDSIREPGEFHQENYEHDPAIQKQWSDYWAAKRELVKSAGVELVSHCSGDYPMYILAVKSSVITAHRGYPKRLPNDMVADPEWRKVLEGFCEKTGIPMQEPGYILCSNWS